MRGDPLDRCVSHFRHRVDADRRWSSAFDRAFQPLRLCARLSQSRLRQGIGSGHYRRCHHLGGRPAALPPHRPRDEGLAMGMVQQPMFSEIAPAARRAFFALAVFAVCLLFMFPVLWLILTSLRPVSGVYYVHCGLEFTLGNFAEVFFLMIRRPPRSTLSPYTTLAT